MIKSNKKTVVLLIQLGTPESLSRRSVARFIRRFLNDPGVTGIPAILRKPLVSVVIAPLRSGIALERYRQIWDPQTGSPLLHYTSSLERSLNDRALGLPPVFAAYQYSPPSVELQLEQIKNKGFNDLIIIPLYPQPAPSTTGSAIAQAEKLLDLWTVRPFVRWITPLWDRPGYVDLLARQIAACNPLNFDKIIFSYHGLPLKQAVQGYSLACRVMTDQLARKLGISSTRYVMAYQSRFGRGWTGPLTNQVIDEVLAEGARSLLVVAPSFTADCLETTWEIGIDFKRRFLEGGGERFEWVRSFNAGSGWVDWLAEEIRGIPE
jgi:ferrochelatase